MRYIKTVDLWDSETSNMIRTGQLQLQKGQWVRCGNPDKLSRFVGIKPCKTILAAHWSGSPKETRERFKTLCKIM